MEIEAALTLGAQACREQGFFKFSRMYSRMVGLRSHMECRRDSNVLFLVDERGLVGLPVHRPEPLQPRLIPDHA